MHEVIAGRSPLEMLIDDAKSWEDLARQWNNERGGYAGMSWKEVDQRKAQIAEARRIADAFFTLAIMDVEQAIADGKHHEAIDHMISCRVRSIHHAS